MNQKVAQLILYILPPEGVKSSEIKEYIKSLEGFDYYATIIVCYLYFFLFLTLGYLPLYLFGL